MNAAVQYVTLDTPPINWTFEENILEYFKCQNNEAYLDVLSK